MLSDGIKNMGRIVYSPHDFGNKKRIAGLMILHAPLGKIRNYKYPVKENQRRAHRPSRCPSGEAKVRRKDIHRALAPGRFRAALTNMGSGIFKFAGRCDAVYIYRIMPGHKIFRR